MKILFLTFLLLSIPCLHAESPDDAPENNDDTPFLQAVGDGPNANDTMRPQYRGAALDLLLQEIGDRTGRVILRDPAVSDVSITLISNTHMPVNEFLKAAENLLAMHNISLVPFRDQFINVVPAQGVERAGAPLILDSVEQQGDDAQIVSQLLTLKHLDYTEVQPLITERLSPRATVQVMERTNALLITDTRANIGRIQKIMEVLDRPADVRESVKIYQLSNATAADVKTRLEALIEESQLDQASPRRRTAAPARETPRGIIRPGGSAQSEAPSSAPAGSGPTPGLVRGKVQIVADERTNVLIIISRPENDGFFEEMIGVLDKQVDPEVTVRIHGLQFASAEDVSATLNELIGAATSDSTGRVVQSDRDAESRQGQTVRDFIRQQAQTRTESPTEESASGLTSIGRLGENTRILADTRTNTLILMGRNKDLDVLEGVIQRLDIMLAQVAVRAVIMEVSLNDNFSYGIDWLQRSLTVNNVENINGFPIREPVMSFGGGQNMSSTSTAFRDGASVDREISLSPGSLSYFTTLYDFNLDVVLRMAQGSSDAKVIATPIIVTTDNTEASIRVGERRAIPTTTATTIGGSIQSSFEYENIGLELTVTPRINPQGMVIMEISQTSENVGGTTRIDGNDVPIITSRALEASVAIRSGGTLVLGGLVREDARESMTKVPLLGSIPILGALFRSKSTENVRTELLVLISPEVLVTTEEAENMTRELKKATQLNKADWYQGWDLGERGDWGKEDTVSEP
jgi:general secretion pathway protein D